VLFAVGGLSWIVGMKQGWLTSAVADGPAMGNEGAWLKRAQ